MFSRGFTLLESLITLSIIAILLVMIVPSFENFFQKSRNDVMSAELMRAIHFARNEAILRDTTVTFCHSRDQKTCSGEWRDGYVLLAENKIVFSFSNHTQDGQLHWRTFPYYLDHIEFASSGFPDFQNGTFWYCPKSSGHPVWAVMINQSGRGRLVYPNAAGEIRDDKGKLLSC